MCHVKEVILIAMEVLLGFYLMSSKNICRGLEFNFLYVAGYLLVTFNVFSIVVFVATVRIRNFATAGFRTFVMQTLGFL